ncbi:MAG: rhodanese-like domain-containing protein [Myxococcaceae bacterium]
MDRKQLSVAARKIVSRGGVLLDVRSPAEYAAGHAEGARNIPVQELEQRVKEVGDPKTGVVVYCKAGMRAASAEQILRKHGFANVLNITSQENY